MRVALRLRRSGGEFVRATRAGQTHPPIGWRVAVVGSAPIRVLLLGGDYAVGYNVPTRALALDGAIADVLHELTGRGVIVENRSRPELPLERAAASIGAIGAHTFDLTVWTPTFTEASRHLLTRPWRRALHEILEVVRRTSDSGLIMLSVPMLLGPQPIAMLARFRAAAITREIRRVVARDPRALVVEPPALEMWQIENPDGRAVYRATAERMAPAMLHLLGISARTPVA